MEYKKSRRGWQAIPEGQKWIGLNLRRESPSEYIIHKKRSW